MVTRLALIVSLALGLAGCAVPAIMLTPAAIGLMSAGAGALAASFRLDQVVVCAMVSAEGIKEAQSVSAVCQAPAVPVTAVVGAPAPPVAH